MTMRGHKNEKKIFSKTVARFNNTILRKRD